MFTARLDGFEERITPEVIPELKISDLDELKTVKAQTQSNVSRGDNVFKIIDNFNWYVAAVLTSEQSEGLQKGDRIDISFRDADDTVAPATVECLGEDEHGRRVVTFRLSRDIHDVLGRRRVSIDIIRKTYEGFKLPTAALAYENGTTGVYVLSGGTQVFKPCEVIYHNEEYMIVKEDNSKENGLLLYDNVIIKGDQ